MRYILSILAIILSIAVNAQNISVLDFHLNEMDLTANQQGSIVLDQNGEKCALIKIKTTQTGFNFDVGSLGVTKTVQKTAQIWVYVPHGVRKLSISHQKYGTLDYQLPVTIQKAKTYIMDLKAETPLPVDHQRLTIKCQPKSAVVMIDGEMADTPNGVGEVTLKLGSHKYIAMAQGYYQSEGTVELKADRPGRLSIDLEAKESLAAVPQQVSTTEEKTTTTQESYNQDEQAKESSNDSSHSDSTTVKEIVNAFAFAFGVELGCTQLSVVKEKYAGKEKTSGNSTSWITKQGMTFESNNKGIITSISIDPDKVTENVPEYFSSLSWNSKIQDWMLFFTSKGLTVKNNTGKKISKSALGFLAGGVVGVAVNAAKKYITVEGGRYMIKMSSYRGNLTSVEVIQKEI